MSFCSTRPLFGFKGVLRRYPGHPEGLPEYHSLSKRWIVRDTERWWLLDCKGQQLHHIARLASLYITGQHRVDFQPGMINGDQIVCINCKDIVMTGDQWIRTPVMWYTQWPGGKYRVRMSDIFNKDPCLVVFNQVRMEVNNHFKRKLKTRVAPLENLWTYEAAVHPHGNKGLRPLQWNPSPVYERYKGQHQKRWTPNNFMQ